MSRTQSIHRRLLTDQVVLLLALGIALLVSTLFGARRAVEKVSQSVISRAVDQAEARLSRFFDPIEASLAAVAAWGEAGSFSLAEPAAFETLVAPVTARLDEISGVLLADEDGNERARLRWLILVVTLVMLAAAVARAMFLAQRFSRSIEALAGESERFSRGDLEPGKAVVSGLTGVQGLADAHRRMRRGLKTLLKLEDDLRLARQIQQETFPQEPPSLYGFDLVGWNRCADETGGDSYEVIGLSPLPFPAIGGVRTVRL